MTSETKTYSIPCTWPGTHGPCGRTDGEHHMVVIYWNSAGNISVRRQTHLWPSKKYDCWVGTVTCRTWSARGRDRVAYRKARNYARKLATEYGGCEVRDGVRRAFLARTDA